MKTTPPPSQPIGPAEHIEALEFVLGQALLAIECDNAALRVQLARIEATLNREQPSETEAPRTQEDIEDEEAQAFTLDSLSQWIARCLERMRAHRSATPRQMVAIGTLTERVLQQEEASTPAQPLAIGPTARAALAKAQQHPNPQDQSALPTPKRSD